MGLGAMAVYSPIIIKLLTTKQAEGFSVATWVFNLIGLSVASAYPFKKGFPFSTYIELVTISVQSAGILGLVCLFQNKLQAYLAVMAAFTIFITGILVTPMSANTLNWLQFAAIIACNWANIPQILLTYRTKQAAWSPITAIMSVAGNLIRIFTTIQLTKDPLVLGGYMLGFTTNSILLGQIFYYGSKK